MTGNVRSRSVHEKFCDIRIFNVTQKGLLDNSRIQPTNEVFLSFIKYIKTIHLVHSCSLPLTIS